MLGPFVPFVVGTHVLLVASSGPPKVDIRATCQTSVNEVTKLFGDATKETVDACLRQQNDAFEQIGKNWESYPAAARAHCVQPGVYMPSYVEWLTCFEMEMDIRKMRAEEAKAAQGKDKAAQGKEEAPRRRPR
jgi:hypothetical protein